MINQITGKALIFTDFHIGISSNKESRLKICINIVKNIIEKIKKDNIKTIIFGGDWHHSRTTLDSNALNVSYKLISALAKYCRCILICGNHDIYLKNSTDINSINIFKDIPNVEIITKAEVVDMNNQHCLLVPWLADLSIYDKNSFDFMIGHFDISTKYLISSYIEEHSKNDISENVINNIDNDDMLNSEKSTTKSAEIVGSFIDLCKNKGTIFAGHIHKHKEFISKGRKFIFVGSPYQQNLGDIGNACGYYVINEDGKYEFIEITDVPKHVQIYTSKILEIGIDKFDFSIAANNIVQKVYDCDIKEADDIKINQKISIFKPYEELLPEYAVEIDITNNNSSSSITLDIIKKSKLEYIKNYIDMLDDKIIKENDIDREDLFNIMSEYYAKVIDN